MRDLSKKKFTQISKSLEAAQDAFRAEIEKLAEEARAEILPYFKKHNYDFLAGAGWGWSISKPEAAVAMYYRPGDYLEDEELPPRIRELLNLEVAYNDQLGLHIRDIKRGEW